MELGVAAAVHRGPAVPGRTLNGLSWEPDDVRLDAIRDVYLAEWGDPGALRPVADAALRLACIGPALSWSRALRDAPSEAHAQRDHPVTRWIEELLPPAL